MIKEITEIKISADDKELIERLQKTNFVADDEFLSDFKKKFLECDYKRADLGIYTEEVLFNPLQGHWDLWDYNESIDSDIIVKLPEPIYARNPKDDVVANVISIDFGNKGTHVSYKDICGNIIPINVGKIQEASDLNDFENPSIMYFVNFEKFLKDYNSKIGRPETKWDDLTIAYDALNDLRSADKSNFDSFLTDLKSWCSSNKINRVKDREGQLYKFKPFLEIGEGDPNPLEYYAYFLGLYINNMNSGKIFMNYKMSFPVSFSRELRKKIIDSFARGIKKSFPTALLKDSESMKQFVVEEGYEEPVACAINVLNDYNFESKNNEYYYSVFDFGSEKTDFDFGVYNKNSIVHFGAYRDINLGGEKLLKYLAFEIFKINRKNLVFPDGTKIKFTRDDFCTNVDSFEFETLIDNNSTYANRNMYTLIEKLRWAWEGVKPGEENLEDDYNKGAIYLDLINDRGEIVPNFQLSSFKINEDGSQEFVDLQELLRRRIDKTVCYFFSAMREAFKNASKNKKYGIKDLIEAGDIHIFLAGNSTKSKLFLEIFDSYIKVNGNDNFLYEYNYGYEEDDNCKAKKILGLDFRFYVYPLFSADRYGYESLNYNGDYAISYGLLIDGVDVNKIEDVCDDVCEEQNISQIEELKSKIEKLESEKLQLEKKIIELSNALKGVDG